MFLQNKITDTLPKFYVSGNKINYKMRKTIIQEFIALYGVMQAGEVRTGIMGT